MNWRLRQGGEVLVDLQKRWGLEGGVIGLTMDIREKGAAAKGPGPHTTWLKRTSGGTVGRMGWRTLPNEDASQRPVMTQEYIAGSVQILVFITGKNATSRLLHPRRTVHVRSVNGQTCLH